MYPKLPEMSYKLLMTRSDSADSDDEVDADL